MTAVSMALFVALIVSMIANVALVGQLRTAKRREEDWKNERFW